MCLSNDIVTGLILKDTGGYITVRKNAAGQSRYSGTTRFGITSKFYWRWTSSFHLTRPTVQGICNEKTALKVNLLLILLHCFLLCFITQRDITKRNVCHCP